MKLLIPANSLLTTSVLLTSAVVANTYTTTINIEYQTPALKLAQTKPMQFATVVFNEHTANGQSCFTDNKNKDDNALCAGRTGQAKNSAFEISGPPGGTVVVSVSSGKMTLEGIEFTPLLIGDNTLTLDKKGRARYNIGGQLTLVDGAATHSTSLTFSYDVELASQ